MLFLTLFLIGVPCRLEVALLLHPPGQVVKTRRHREGRGRCLAEEEVSEWAPDSAHVLPAHLPCAHRPTKLLHTPAVSPALGLEGEGWGIQDISTGTAALCVSVRPCACACVLSDSCWVDRESWFSVQIPAWGYGEFQFWRWGWPCHQRRLQMDMDPIPAQTIELWRGSLLPLDWSGDLRDRCDDVERKRKRRSETGEPVPLRADFVRAPLRGRERRAARSWNSLQLAGTKPLKSSLKSH